MKICQLIELLNKAHSQTGPDADILLAYEEAVMEDGYDPQQTEGISDVRLVDDWPLPGTSLVNYEGEKPKKIVILYDNHFKLDSSVEP